ncbi:YciI family protein [Nonomuraea rhizosphaerae]|uniref:YciI family protein n=1 Tax=Nonomuraea rhizosphaerae TaxID=2665663 RepID=UPI001C5D4AB6|nr:YciI family protein [Nonomuraea rhizosphaerae]
MKYMLLIHNRPGYVGELSDADREALMSEVEAIMKELTASGEFVRGEALADPSATRTVKVRDGVPAVTDGPFIEAKEHFAGHIIVDVDSLERATEIAARWPDAKYAAMEVREVIHVSEPEA